MGAPETQGERALIGTNLSKRIGLALRVAYLLVSSLFCVVVGVLILWKIYKTFGKIDTLDEWAGNVLFFLAALWMIRGGMRALADFAASRNTNCRPLRPLYSGTQLPFLAPKAPPARPIEQRLLLNSRTLADLQRAMPDAFGPLGVRVVYPRTTNGGGSHAG